MTWNPAGYHSTPYYYQYGPNIQNQNNIGVSENINSPNTTYYSSPNTSIQSPPPYKSPFLATPTPNVRLNNFNVPPPYVYSSVKGPPAYLALSPVRFQLQSTQFYPCKTNQFNFSGTTQVTPLSPQTFDLSSTPDKPTTNTSKFFNTFNQVDTAASPLFKRLNVQFPEHNTTLNELKDTIQYPTIPENEEIL